MTRRFFILLVILVIAAATLCRPLAAQTAIGELTASDASVKGAVVMENGRTQVLSGSSVTAGEDTASVRLERGGEVRVCPRSSVSLTASQNGHNLMLAIGIGSIETHYSLPSSADTILTPDFRLLLAGPGTFHFAIASDTHGNTCVRSLESDTAAIIVNETMGDGMYQVSPGGKVLFRNGSVKDATDQVPLDCGCPPPPETAHATTDLSATTGQAAAATPPSPIPAAPESLTTPPPATAPDEVHISVDAPFVFRAKQPVIPPPPPVTRLRLETVPAVLFNPPVQPPSPPPPPTAESLTDRTLKPIKKTLGHVRSFFGSMFH
jgi:hypothetical protein